ncbi:hypothetical protein THAOC_24933, partial [Thalassiosira oceanica]
KVKQFEAEYGEDWEDTAIEYGDDCVSLPFYVVEPAAKGGNFRTATLQWLGKGNIKDRVNAKCENAGNIGLLFLAADAKEHDLMIFLLLNGADVNIMTSDGFSALATFCNDSSDILTAVKILLSWGAEIFAEGRLASSQDMKQLCFKTIMKGNAAVANLLSSELGGRRCKIVIPPDTRDDLVGKTCVVGRHIEKSSNYEVAVEFTNESLMLGADKLERYDRTPQDPGYFVECKNNRLIRRDFESNEECRAFIASLGKDEGLLEVDPDAEAKAEQAAADLLAELGLDDLEDVNSNAPKKVARSAPPAGKKKKRGGKKKGRNNITQRHMSLPPRPVPAPHDVRAEARARHAVPHRDVRERFGPDAAVHAPQGEADAVPRDERVDVREQTGSHGREDVEDTPSEVGGPDDAESDALQDGRAGAGRNTAGKAGGAFATASARRAEPDDRAGERLDDVLGNKVAPRPPQSHAVPGGRPVEEAGGGIKVHAPERDGVRPLPGDGVPDRAVFASVRRGCPGGRAVGRAPRPRLVVGGRAAGGAAARLPRFLAVVGREHAHRNPGRPDSRRQLERLGPRPAVDLQDAAGTARRDRRREDLAAEALDPAVRVDHQGEGPGAATFEAERLVPAGEARDHGHVRVRVGPGRDVAEVVRRCVLYRRLLVSFRSAASVSSGHVDRRLGEEGTVQDRQREHAGGTQLGLPAVEVEDRHPPFIVAPRLAESPWPEERSRLATPRARRGRVHRLGPAPKHGRRAAAPPRAEVARDGLPGGEEAEAVRLLRPGAVVAADRARIAVLSGRRFRGSGAVPHGPYPDPQHGQGVRPPLSEKKGGNPASPPELMRVVGLATFPVAPNLNATAATRQFFGKRNGHQWISLRGDPKPRRERYQRCLEEAYRTCSPAAAAALEENQYAGNYRKEKRGRRCPLCRGTIPPSRDQISSIKMTRLMMKRVDKSNPMYEEYAREVKEFEAEYGEDWEDTAIEYGNDCVSLPLYVAAATAKGGNFRTTALQWLGKGNIKDRVNAKCESFGNVGLLYLAAVDKEYDLMTFLLLNGADVNVMHSEGLSGRRVSSQELKLLVDKIIMEGNAAVANLISSELGGRRCKIVIPPDTRDDLVGKTCVVGRHIEKSSNYEVAVEFTNESLMLGADKLERYDRTPHDPGYFVECKNNRLIRRDFESNEECRAFIASLGTDEGLPEVDPEAEAKAEQAAADLLAELGLDDLEGSSSNAQKKGARSAPPAGKKKKRGGKKKGRK